jgi:hypothetical protein
LRPSRRSLRRKFFDNLVMRSCADHEAEQQGPLPPLRDWGMMRLVLACITILCIIIVDLLLFD